jgi:PAS domain S-box-containing protein
VCRASKQPDITTVLNALAAVLPGAFQHPSIAAVRLCLGNKEVKTSGFVNSRYALHAEFITADSLPGSIEVIYNDAGSSGNMPAFVNEEQVLLTTLADMLRIAYDRWQAEERLQLSEERYRTFVKATSLIDWTTDADAHFCHMEGWVELTGQTEAQAAGDGWLEVVHPEDRAKAARVWEESEATQTPYINEYRLRTKKALTDMSLRVACPLSAMEESENGLELSSTSRSANKPKSLSKQQRHKCVHYPPVWSSRGKRRALVSLGSSTMSLVRCCQ